MNKSHESYFIRIQKSSFSLFTYWATQQCELYHRCKRKIHIGKKKCDLLIY